MMLKTQSRKSWIDSRRCTLTASLRTTSSFTSSEKFSFSSSTKRRQQTNVNGGGASLRKEMASRRDFPYSWTWFTYQTEHGVGTWTPVVLISSGWCYTPVMGLHTTVRDRSQLICINRIYEGPVIRSPIVGMFFFVMCRRSGEEKQKSG